LHGTIETVKGTLNGLHGTIGAVKGTLNDLHGTIGTVNGTLSSLHGTIGTVNGTLSSLHGTIGTVNGTLNGLHGTVFWCSSSLQGLYLIIITSEMIFIIFFPIFFQAMIDPMPLTFIRSLICDVIFVLDHSAFYMICSQKVKYFKKKKGGVGQSVRYTHYMVCC
jgi:magnesium-transporting ATPase (P-type)